MYKVELFNISKRLYDTISCYKRLVLHAMKSPKIILNDKRFLIYSVDDFCP